MKVTKDPHAEFGLKRELIIEASEAVSQRNLQWIRGNFDNKDPTAILTKLDNAPKDKDIWVLALLKKHGLKEVDLVTWIAATSFLTHCEKAAGMGVLQKIMSKFSHN